MLHVPWRLFDVTSVACHSCPLLACTSFRMLYFAFLPSLHSRSWQSCCLQSFAQCMLESHNFAMCCLQLAAAGLGPKHRWRPLSDEISLLHSCDSSLVREVVPRVDPKCNQRSSSRTRTVTVPHAHAQVHVYIASTRPCRCERTRAYVHARARLRGRGLRKPREPRYLIELPA